MWRGMGPFREVFGSGIADVYYPEISPPSRDTRIYVSSGIDTAMYSRL
jgi:hypothetical protein